MSVYWAEAELPADVPLPPPPNYAAKSLRVRPQSTPGSGRLKQRLEKKAELADRQHARAQKAANAAREQSNEKMVTLVEFRQRARAESGANLICSALAAGFEASSRGSLPQGTINTAALLEDPASLSAWLHRNATREKLGGRLLAVAPTLHCVRGAALHERFMNAMTPSLEVRLVFHGTRRSNVVPLCRDGFTDAPGRLCTTLARAALKCAYDRAGIGQVVVFALLVKRRALPAVGAEAAAPNQQVSTDANAAESEAEANTLDANGDNTNKPDNAADETPSVGAMSMNAIYVYELTRLAEAAVARQSALDEPPASPPPPTKRMPPPPSHPTAPPPSAVAAAAEAESLGSWLLPPGSSASCERVEMAMPLAVVTLGEKSIDDSRRGAILRALLEVSRGDADAHAAAQSDAEANGAAMTKATLDLDAVAARAEAAAEAVTAAARAAAEKAAVAAAEAPRVTRPMAVAEGYTLTEADEIIAGLRKHRPKSGRADKFDADNDKADTARGEIELFARNRHGVLPLDASDDDEADEPPRVYTGPNPRLRDDERAHMLQGLLHAGWGRFGYYTEPFTNSLDGPFNGYDGSGSHGPWGGATSNRHHAPPPQPWWGEVATPQEQLQRDLYFRGLERFGHARGGYQNHTGVDAASVPFTYDTYDEARGPVRVAPVSVPKQGVARGRGTGTGATRRGAPRPRSLPHHEVRETERGYVGKIRFH